MQIFEQFCPKAGDANRLVVEPETDFNATWPSGYTDAHQPTRGVGSVVSSPNGVRGGATTENWFWCILSLRNKNKSGDDEFDIFSHWLGGRGVI